MPSLTAPGFTEHSSAACGFRRRRCDNEADVGTILDQQGIAVRTGHHCAQPAMDRFQVPATARVSLAFYNTKGEIDALVKGIQRVIEVFS